MKTFTLVFSLVIATGAFWYGIKLIRLYLRVKSWDRARATITKKTVVKRTLTSSSRAGFKPGVEYQYTFNSKTYNGNKLILVELIKGERGFLENGAQKFIDKIEPEVALYVNPQHPEQAVVYCTGIGLYILALIMGAVSVLIGLSNYFS